MKWVKIASAFFFLVAIALAAFFVYRIKFKIDEDRFIDTQEKMVIARLQMVRDAQIAFLAGNQRYAGSWDTLVAFIDTGNIYITNRREKIEILEYGRENVTITIDTIGQVPVKDSLFIVKEFINSVTNGIVESVNVQPGDIVTRGQTLAIIENERGRKISMVSPVAAKVRGVYVADGMPIRRDDNIVYLTYDRISDIHNLPFIPGTNQQKKFDLFAGKIVKGNVTVDVFEAKDTNPINPRRKKNNNERALRVGSRVDVSTSGNWE
ncbi:MAG: acetyl-CoA carboxylase biotin carboxyl carrier protein subunit [Cyclobacteriaceae bacterium]|nr:acetyl-CoA carboxylase biotin carboxyl carrier protein subunit [Cyclobacteriaceae bacterium]